MPGQRSATDVLLEIADDELVLGWRNSEWTGIAPFLEEDVAFSSIAQNEIGHARALYELVAHDLGKTADELAFDRRSDEYRCAPLVELRLPDWADTVVRHFLYETADQVRIEALKASGEANVAGLAAKIDREEAYHRMHAQMWIDRLHSSDEGRRRLRDSVEKLWPYAVALLAGDERERFRERVGPLVPGNGAEPVERGTHTEELAPLWEEMTMVRRSVPGAAW